MDSLTPVLGPVAMLCTLKCLLARREKLWLENVQGVSALRWVKKQSKDTIGRVGDPKEEGKTEEYDRLLSMYESKDKIPYVLKIGEKHYYNFWTDDKHVRGIWRRTTLESYATKTPEWETVLDVDALNEKEGKSFVWKGSTVLHEGPNSENPKGELCFVKLSPGGSDAVEYREFDLLKKEFVPNGFFIPEAKSRVAWYDRDTVYVGTDDGSPGAMTHSGYPRTVKQWVRGTPLKSAPVVFQGTEEDMMVLAWHSHDARGYEYECRQVIVDFYTSRYTAREMKSGGGDGAWHKLAIPHDAQCSFYGDQVILELRSDWNVGRAEGAIKAGSLVSVPFRSFTQKDGCLDDMQVLFRPRPESSLERTIETKSYLVLELLEHVKSTRKFLRYIPTDQRSSSSVAWEIIASDLPPTMDSFYSWAHDDDEDDLIWCNRSGFLTPSTVELVDVKDLIENRPTAEKKRPVSKSQLSYFDASNLAVSQNFCLSKDGTKIPYFQVSKKGMKLDGTNPAILYGYGGFEVSMTPYYSATIGMSWLEKGGVYVLSNIRGGKEYGPEWHKSALKEHRHKAYEDFEAIAEDLIARKVTSAKKLGIMGGSNGGLLVGNCMTRRPELFGAVVCQVPLLDMGRYTKLLAGASWMAEFGDPDIPEQWNGYLRNHSPFHRLLDHPKGEYPKAFFYTSTRDDRVHPGHARKMVYRLLQLGHGESTYYYENTEGGHGGGADSPQRAFMWSLTYKFLRKTLMDE
jgi:prolyl oligopeptidase